VWSGGIGNSSVCSTLHNGEIYSLNESVLIILFGTDIAYRMFEAIIELLYITQSVPHSKHCLSLQTPSVNSVYVRLRSVEIKDTSLAKCEVLWSKIKLSFAEIS
jgi:hypothetical protein